MGGKGWLLMEGRREEKLKVMLGVFLIGVFLGIGYLIGMSGDGGKGGKGGKECLFECLGWWWLWWWRMENDGIQYMGFIETNTMGSGAGKQGKEEEMENNWGFWLWYYFGRKRSR